MQKEKTEKTKSVRKKIILFLLIPISLGLMVATIFRPTTDCKKVYRNDLQMKINDKLIETELANDFATRQKGLSGRECIGDNQAMLFEFDTSERWGIWMKDMKFSIDIVWLDADKKVIDVEEGVSPDSYPSIFYPKGFASYVIEFGQGGISRKNITVGDQISW